MFLGGVQLGKDPQGYLQYCPIAITSEIMCSRWTTVILRAFFCGATKFSDIQKSAPHMSSATLASRLKQLEDAGVLDRSMTARSNVPEYQLTRSGEALFPILDQMGIWSQNWLRREIIADENLDPDVLFWELRQLTNFQKKHPSRRRVAKFLLSGVPTSKQCYWIVFDPHDTEVCAKDPGYDIDLNVSAHIRTLVEIWLGHTTLSAAQESQKISLDGSTSETKAFSKWFMLSHFSKVGLANTI